MEQQDFPLPSRAAVAKSTTSNRHSQTSDSTVKSHRNPNLA